MWHMRASTDIRLTSLVLPFSDISSVFFFWARHKLSHWACMQSVERAWDASVAVVWSCSLLHHHLLHASLSPSICPSCLSLTLSWCVQVPQDTPSKKSRASTTTAALFIDHFIRTEVTKHIGIVSQFLFCLYAFIPKIEMYHSTRNDVRIKVELNSDLNSLHV